MRQKRSCFTKLVLTAVLTASIWLPDELVNAVSEHHFVQKHIPLHTNHNREPNIHQQNISRNLRENNSTLQRRNIHTVVELDTKQFPSKHKRELHTNAKKIHESHQAHAQQNATQNFNTKENRDKRKADPQFHYPQREQSQIQYGRGMQYPRGDSADQRYRDTSQASLLRHENMSPFEGDRPNGQANIRNRLLEALARRITERNMLMHDPNILRDRERTIMENAALLQRPEYYTHPHEQMLDNRDHLSSYPLENTVHESRVPFRERLLEANGIRSLHHHQPIIDPRLLSGELTGYDPGILPNHRMFSNVGNLGDETMPYGSLGETKPSDYIPVGRVSNLQNEYQDNSVYPQSNQDIANEEVTEFVPASPHKRHKKTWITDVNVYSKKKKDDINSMLNDDNDNDPMDEFDPCDKQPCHNGGICKVTGNTEYICICPRTFKGKRCEIRNRCHPTPCLHGSKCTETNTGFKCSCGVGFKGKRCQERNYCLPNPCMNDAVCTESTSSDGFACTCKETWYGRICDQKRTACTPSPCQNHGHCFTDGTEAFECVCQKGTSGKLCQDGENSFHNIAHGLFHSDDDSLGAAVEKSMISTPSANDVKKSFACEANPCLNGGMCKKDVTQPKGYECQCQGSFHGPMCEEQKCECENGGTCIGEGTEVRCACKPGYGGKLCQEHTQCNEDTCLHGGICIEQVGGFHCKCDNGYKGQRCEEYDKCKPNPCLHGGGCKDYGDFYKCECKRGFKGKQCEDIDLCQPNPCHNGGQCFGYVGGFQCECLPGYSGKICDQRIHCLSNPCSNGAECIEVPPAPEKPTGSFKCGCKTGFMGDSCEDKDFCHNSPCHNGGSCVTSKDGFLCSCHDKYHGNHCQHINHCFGSPCKNNGKCTSSVHEFKCECSIGFKGVICEDVDYCQPNPCKNGGYCSANEAGNGFVCQCSEGHRGLTCSDVDPCYPNPCSHGHCVELAGGYLCNCTLGFKGAKCTEINHCDPNPCFHGGTCEEINGGIGYVCQCVPGYNGEMCEKKDLCHPNPCQNEGECSDATRTYDGHNKYSSEANSQPDAIHCTCAKGFLGDRCKDSDPCYPNPCQHNSLCIVDGHSPLHCNCSIGWKGEHCSAVDLCSPDPCRYGTHCIQTDEESYQCVKNLCSPNPCSNEGKCIVVNDEGFECACPKGWKGKSCTEQDSCFPNPCENGGTCHDMDGGGYTCECPRKYAGNKCQIEEKPEQAKDYCAAYPCKNGGTCIDTEGGFTCRCNSGFSGPFCEDSVCHPPPCDNGGTCVPYYGIALCKCQHEFTGAHCSELKRPGTVQHSDINTVKMTDTLGQTKSFTPHVTEILKHSGANSPLLVERVEEILNSDKDKTEPVSAAKIAQLLQPVQQLSAIDTVKPSEQKNPAETPLAAQRLLPPNPTEAVAFPAEPSQAQPPNAAANTAKPSQQAQQAQQPNPSFTAKPSQQSQQAIPSGTAKPSQALQPSPANMAMLVKDSTQSGQPPPVATFQPGPPTSSMVPASTNALSAPVPAPMQKAETMVVSTPTGPVFRPVIIVKTQDPCEPNICQHGGICVVRSNGQPECICATGFSGPVCKEIGLLGYSSAPKFFPNNECKHCDRNSICVNGHCICEQNYVGDGLECWPATQEDKDWSCEPSPCQNGGTCKPGRAKCVCKLGFIGKYCETYCQPSVHLSFDTMKGPYVKDESSNNNNAVLRNGAEIIYEGGKCDSGASLLGGDILLDGRNFQPKPVDSVTMVVWIKLDTSRGIQSVFDTVGGERSTHREGQYHLEVDNARVRWFHRNEKHVTIFSIITDPLLVEGNWTHIAGTYSGEKRVAKLFVNGDLVGIDANTSSEVYLSQDWDTKAGIGKHEHPFGNRLLRGMVDEFYIFACSLPRLEILVLMHHCKIYWKHDSNTAASSKHEVAGTTDSTSPTSISSTTGTTSISSISTNIQPQITAANLAALKKNKNRFQNYIGFETELKQPHVVTENNRAMAFTNRPVAAEVTVSGNQRYRIARPGHNAPVISQPKYIINRPTQNIPFVRKAIPSQAWNYMNSMPQGPNALYAEVREMLNRERLVAQSKRMHISPAQQIQDIEKKLAIKLKPNVPLRRFHHAPVVRNENKELPFGPHAYLTLPKYPDVALNPIPGIAKSTFPVLPPYDFPHVLPQVPQQAQNNIRKSAFIVKQPKPVNIAGPSAFFGADSPIAAKKSPVPTMFDEIMLQAGNNHDSRPSVRSKSFRPKTPFTNPDNPLNNNMADPRWFGWSKGLANTNGGTHTNTHTNTLQRNDPGTAAVGTHVTSSQNSGGKTKQSQKQGKNENMFNIPQPNYAVINAYPSMSIPNQQQYMQRAQFESAQRKQIHTEDHGHQWGFGNGNGNGNGVGTPGGSGSGGGWGAGGPLKQSVSLPGWSGNPPDGPPWGDKAEETQQKQKQAQQAQQPQQQKSFVVSNTGPTYPVNARDIWNRYVAQKKQSTSEMHADSTNEVAASTKINPLTPQNMQVQNHGFGYGNGNGNAEGNGPGGGTGDGGGWGAGGPVKQETRLPGQKSFIHNPSLPFAIAQSFKAPWLAKSSPNNEKPQAHVNPNYIPKIPDFDRRSQITSYQPTISNLYQPSHMLTANQIMPNIPSQPAQFMSNNMPSFTQGNMQPNTAHTRTIPNVVRSNVPLFPQQPAQVHQQITKNPPFMASLENIARADVPLQVRIAGQQPAQNPRPPFMASLENIARSAVPIQPNVITQQAARNARQKIKNAPFMASIDNIPRSALPIKPNVVTQQIVSNARQQIKNAPFMASLEQEVNPTHNIADAAEFNPQTSNMHNNAELSLSDRRDIITQAITDAMHGLKKKKKKKKKRKRSSKEKRHIKDVG